MTVIALFPPGVHDAVVEHVADDVSRISCSEGDWLTVDAHTRDEIRWVFAAHALHARQHRGMCHPACYDQDGQTDGCLYEGDEI